MKRLILVVAAMLVLATSAHAVGGIDLSVNACPGNSGAMGVNDFISIDCAGGGAIVLLGTWAPSEDIVGLTSLNGRIRIYIPAGLAANGFWDFDPTGCNSLALSSNHARPPGGCSTPVDYTATWSPAGSGSAIAALRTSDVFLTMQFVCYRSGPLNVSAEQKLFGVQIVIDGSNAVEAGGPCAGCNQGVGLVWTDATPSTASGSLSPLFGPTGHYPGFGDCIVFGLGQCEPGLPARRSTWGQLKSLYR
jgi:hypothetical protein